MQIISQIRINVRVCVYTMELDTYALYYECMYAVQL